MTYRWVNPDDFGDARVIGPDGVVRNFDEMSGEEHLDLLNAAIREARAVPSGHILTDDGCVLPMAPKADGTPSTLQVTKDGYVLGDGAKFYYQSGVSVCTESHMTNCANWYAIRANAEAAAKEK